jgi:hypothetical protein
MEGDVGEAPRRALDDVDRLERQVDLIGIGRVYHHAFKLAHHIPYAY